MDFATVTAPALTAAGVEIVTYGVLVLGAFSAFYIGIAGVRLGFRWIKRATNSLG